MVYFCVDKMRVRKYTKRITILLSILAIFACCCRSTKQEDLTLLEVQELHIDKEDNEFCLYENISLENTNVEDRYIFFRLYEPYYRNPFCVENILKSCIMSIDVNPTAASHSAIGFDLNDCFYGLTTAGKKDLKPESCTDTLSNGYMKKCDKYKSVQITYAIKVTEAEYEKAKKLVQDFFDNPKTKYSVLQNFAIAGYGLKRAMFTSPDKKQFAQIPNKRPEDTFAQDRYDFVCSTFIAYVLANSVDSVKQFFIEKGIDSNYVLPSDLEHIPGAIRLFKSTWVDYNVAAKTYCSVYSVLTPFYKEYLATE